MIAGLLNQLVTVAPHTGNDAKGRPVYGTAVQYAARVQAKPRIVLTRDGHDILSSARVYIVPSAVVAIDSQLTLPDGSQPIVLQVYPQYDKDGNLDHWMVDA